MVETMGAVKQLAVAETYVDPGTGQIRVSDSFPITPSFGVVWYRSLDLGFPDVRESAQDNPQADGTFDETQYTGARNVTIEGVVIGNAYGNKPAENGWPSDVQWNSASWFTSLLSAWASPARRFRLYFTDEIGRSRFMDVRGDSFTSALSKNSHEVREFQLNMVNPSGKVYSFGGTSGSPVPGGSVFPDGRWEVPISVDDTGEEGREYPEAGPYTRNYPPGSTAFNAIRYGGTVPNGCTIQIFTAGSTMISPRVTFTAPNGTTSSIGLGPGLTVAANTTITIDTIGRTVTSRLNSTAVSTNIAQHLVAPLQWPQLRPGINRTATEEGERVRGYNRVEFSASSASADATITVLYHEADLL